MSRAGLERVDRGRIDDDMESKEGRPYGRDEDLYRWAAAAAPEPGPIGLVVEDHGRSGQGRNTTPLSIKHRPRCYSQSSL